MAETGKRKDAFGAFYFEVEIAGVVHPFRSCSGLKSESTVVELQEGGFNTTTRKLIGPTKYPNIVLKQGFAGADSPLWQLRKRFMNDLGSGKQSESKGWQTPNRFSGTIIQKGLDGSRHTKWTFWNAWICKWEGPEFDATKNEISIETVEIAHEGLDLVSGEGDGLIP